MWYSFTAYELDLETETIPTLIEQACGWLPVFFAESLDSYG